MTIARMSADEFLEWDSDETDRRHELIDGEPEGKPWNNLGQDRIVVNTIAALQTQLREGPCRAFTANVAVKISNGNVRRPHVGVNCEELA
jgi:Uma2 family endonuclease